MKRLCLTTMPMLVTSVLLAGCGSGGKTTSASSQTNTPASATTSSGGYAGGYGTAAYGPGSTAATPSATTGATQISAKHSKLGTILAGGPKQMTVYLFEGDKACTGACATAWPPVITSTKPTAHGQAVAGDLATITRSDGTKQVTYKGHPLYYFIRDKDSGDAYGEGVKAFGAGWYVLSPSGQKIDRS